MPRPLCPRCAHQYDDEGFKVVCSRSEWGCADEIELSDPASREAWKGLKLILNARIGEDQLKDMADSAGVDKIMNDWLEVKDMDTRRNLILKWAKRIASEAK